MWELQAAAWAISLYDKSGTGLQNSGQSSITLGALDCYNDSRAYAQGFATSGHAHSINVKLLYLHDATAANMSGVDIPSGLWTEGKSYTGLDHSTVGFEVGAGGSIIDLNEVYVSAGILQFDSSLIHIFGASTVMSTITAYGWADGQLPQGYPLAGGIIVGGGMYYGTLNAKGGEIDIYGGAIVKGPLYADPKAAYNKHSMVVHGHKLGFTITGHLTGFVADNWPINVPWSGAVEIDNGF